MFSCFTFNYCFKMLDMCRIKISVIIFTLLCLITLCTCEDNCIRINDCACRFPNGSLVDISTLGNQNGTPRFSNYQDPKTLQKYNYSFNPCYAFTEGKCVKVAVCQKDLVGGIYYNLGNPSPVTFFMDNLQLTVNYSSRTDTETRISSVKLVCDSTMSEPELTVEGENLLLVYRFTLRSKCACANGCVAASRGDEGLSTGSVLVILLFVFLLCYILGGIVFQKVMKGATGKELIPNYDFWMDFPLLVRDGVIFTCNGCQNEVSYERI